MVFPELIVSGYLAPEAVSALAAPLDAAPVRTIRAAARGAGQSPSAFGYPELAADGRKHNSFVLVDPSGAIATVYRKMHLWGAEADWAAAGTEVPMAGIAGARVSGWICFDTRFPELARLAALPRRRGRDRADGVARAGARSGSCRCGRGLSTTRSSSRARTSSTPASAATATA